MPFTARQKAKCVLWFAKLESVTSVQRRFRQEYRVRKTPNYKSIMLWYRTFEETGFKMPHTGGRRRNLETEAAISAAMTASPKKSLRRLSAERAIPYTTCQRIVRKYLKLYPYRMQRVQALHDVHHQQRFEFASTVCDRMEEDDNFLNRWVFSDEATFHLSGRVNTHNAIIWGRENPHVSYELERVSPKVNVWCGISRYKLYGPFMFGEETVRSGPYLDMLQHFFIPQLQQDNSMDIVFQQDGAPPHWATVVRDYLDDTFDGNWCGRSGPIMWPPNSPDLTPPDFFLWGFVKNDVYSQRPMDIDDLKEKICTAFQKVTPQMLHHTWDAISSRYELCRLRNGGHVEV